MLDIGQARAQMKGFLREISYRPKPGDEGTIKDLFSDARLNIKLRTDVEMMQGYGRYTAGQNPETLDQFPAQELVRVARRKVPRNWAATWRAAGGKFYGRGRMIAAKDDPIWTAISRFGLPYPPFDYNSGMGLRDVRREEAEALGVMEPGHVVAPAPRLLTDDVQASASRFALGLQAALEATGFAVRDGVLTP